MSAPVEVFAWVCWRCISAGEAPSPLEAHNDWRKHIMACKEKGEAQ